VSQANVEKIVGRLATDESFRRRYWQERSAVLAELIESGCELNPCEQRALAAISQESVERFAAAIDPRLQKTDLCFPERSLQGATRAGSSERKEP
jgi:hypothetical protein